MLTFALPEPGQGEPAAMLGDVQSEVMGWRRGSLHTHQVHKVDARGRR